MDDVFVGLGVAGLVRHIPAKRLKEGIEELPAQLRFVVTLTFVGIAVLLESFDECGDNGGNLPHVRRSVDWFAGESRGKSAACQFANVAYPLNPGLLSQPGR